MIDLFRKKALAKAEAEIKSLNQANEHLIAQIRAMDQLIFQMSQCSNFDSMRPHYNELQAMATTRMQRESDRIRDVLVPEIKKAYLPHE